MRILTPHGETDERYPEIPEVASISLYEPGTVVAVGLFYGELDPYILGEVL
ncbi:hypothetical protein LJC32_02670 [Oscillospiraceae bacterium OttesenSCG-928-F05]|nr:hypothetical protein [Oscillospiraceae bacterium OttesenSCG-928-F05]